MAANAKCLLAHLVQTRYTYLKKTICEQVSGARFAN